MPYTKSISIFGLCIALLSGCAGFGGGKKESQTSQPDQAQVTQVSPEARKSYDEALVAMRNGDNSAAKGRLMDLTKTYPNLSGPYTNLGLIYFREGEIDDAQAAFEQAIKVNPKSAVSYNHLGIIKRGKGKFKEAEDDYLQALSINKDYAYAHLNIGILYDLYLGELHKALDHYNRFQKLSAEEDQEVKKWIIDLRRRIKSAE